jgi:circadian clock protein KaiB
VSDPARRNSKYVFHLFVAGNETNSAQALTNLVRLCEEHLAGRYEIHTVDVFKSTEAAYKNNVIVTPTLILKKPLPAIRLYGNLRDPGQVLAALRITGGR